MNLTRLAVIGAGHLGRIHARLARQIPEVELVAVVDPIVASRDAVATENQTRSVGSHHELAGQIDAAVIATPTGHHHAVALDLLSRGVHCLVEKPITLSATDADELIAAADKSGAVLQTGHVERFNPAFLAGRSVVEQPRFIDAVRAAPYTFRSTDVSVVLDLMIHDIDLALALIASEVRRIDAVGGKVIGPNEDWAQVRITFANGAVACLLASRVHPSVQRTMQVVGDHGMLWLDFQCKTARATRPSDEIAKVRDINRLSPTERDALKGDLATRHLPVRDLVVTENNAILEEQREFVRAIQAGIPVTADGRVGREAVAVAEEILSMLASACDSPKHRTTLPFLPTFVPSARDARRAA